jgi:hypothetical protein
MLRASEVGGLVCGEIGGLICDVVGVLELRVVL